MSEYLIGDQPGAFPGSSIPDWVILHPEVDEGALAVAAVIASYRNTKSGEPVILKRATLCERFSRKRNWLDRRTALLEKIGHLTRVSTYTDNITKQRTFYQFDAHGYENSQTSNSWIVNEDPPAGNEHQHPIRSSEYSHPHKIDERISHRRELQKVIHTPGSTQNLPSDQGKQEKSPSPTPPGGPHSTPPGGCTAPLRTTTT